MSMSMSISTSLLRLHQDDISNHRFEALDGRS
jgi:hypothetical protein